MNGTLAVRGSASFTAKYFLKNSAQCKQPGLIVGGKVLSWKGGKIGGELIVNGTGCKDLTDYGDCCCGNGMTNVLGTIRTGLFGPLLSDAKYISRRLSLMCATAEQSYIGDTKLVLRFPEETHATKKCYEIVSTTKWSGNFDKPVQFNNMPTGMTNTISSVSQI
jgi:hypothetical protein